MKKYLTILFALISFSLSATMVDFGWIAAQQGGAGTIFPWTTGTQYQVNSAVYQNGIIYSALIAHTSTVFVTDYLNGDWVLIGGTITAPPLSTDNALMRWDGITGTLAQNSSATLNDFGDLSTNSIVVTGTTKASLPCPNMTDVQMKAITGMGEGECVWNTTYVNRYYYDVPSTKWLPNAVTLPWVSGKAYDVGTYITNGAITFAPKVPFISGATIGGDYVAGYLTMISKLDIGTSQTIGGDITINGTTKVDIASGFGTFIDDYTTPFSPIDSPVVWGAVVGMDACGIVAANAYSTFYVTAANVVSCVPGLPTAALYSRNVVLGWVAHVTGTINSIQMAPWQGINSNSQLRDLISFIGRIKHGLELLSRADLSLDRNAGEMFGLGFGFPSDEFPNQKILIAQTPLSFKQITTTTIPAATTILNVTQYQPNGVGALVAISNTNKWVWAPVFSGLNLAYIQYPQQEFGNQADCLADLSNNSQAYKINGDITNLCWSSSIFYQKNAVNTTDPTHFGIINYGDNCHGGTSASTNGGGGEVLGPVSSLVNSVPTFANLTGNVLQDPAKLFIDIANSRVGINQAAPTQALDVTGSIKTSATVMTSAQNAIQLSPWGVAAGNEGELRFLELAANGTNYVGFEAPDSISANVIWNLPNADGTAGQVIKTDGAANLGWSTALIAPATTSTGTMAYWSNGTGTLAQADLAYNDLNRVQNEEIISYNPPVLNNVNGWAGAGGAGANPLIMPVGVNGMYFSNANWIGTVYLPAVSANGTVMYYQTAATISTTIDKTRTNMAANASLTTGNTIIFSSDGTTWNYEGTISNANFGAIRKWPIVYPGTNNVMIPYSPNNTAATAPYAPLDVIGNVYTSIHGSTNEHAAAEIGITSIGMKSGNTADGFTGMKLNVKATDSAGTAVVNNSDIQFWTWGNGISVSREIARFTERGRLGIGTTNPTELLTVAGTPTPVIRADGNTDNQQAGTLFLSQGTGFGYKLFYDATNTIDGLKIVERRNDVETTNMTISQGKTYIGVQDNTVVNNAGLSTLNVVGPGGQLANGPNMSFNDNGDIYPQRQFLNWGHDSVWDCFDCYHDGGGWKNSNASSAFRWSKTSDSLILAGVAAPTAGGTEAMSNYLWFDENGPAFFSRNASNAGPAPYTSVGGTVYLNGPRGTQGMMRGLNAPGGNNDAATEMWNMNGGWGFQRAWQVQTQSPPTVYFDGAISALNVTNRSSRILKKNISPIGEDAIKLFDKIEPVKYQWRDKPYLGRKKGDKLTDREKETKWHFGIIAEDVFKLFPDLFNDGEQTIMEYNDKGIIEAKEVPVKAYSTADLLALAIAKIKELEKRIDALEKK